MWKTIPAAVSSGIFDQRPTTNGQRPITCRQPLYSAFPQVIDALITPVN
jgi:hypothetical protein